MTWEWVEFLKFSSSCSDSWQLPSEEVMYLPRHSLVGHIFFSGKILLLQPTSQQDTPHLPGRQECSWDVFSIGLLMPFFAYLIFPLACIPCTLLLLSQEGHPMSSVSKAKKHWPMASTATGEQYSPCLFHKCLPNSGFLLHCAGWCWAL